MILNLFIHISETERSITRKFLENSNKKHKVHGVRGNSENKTCTIGIFKTVFHKFSYAV
jgi:hypothetical protein